MLEMNPEIRARWCAALRSGEYEQEGRVLRTKEGMNGKRGYCCLGVLTDLYIKAGNPETYESFPGATLAKVWDNGIAASPVCKWAGLAGGNPILSHDSDGVEIVASHHNDQLRTSFAAMADMIDDGEGRE